VSETFKNMDTLTVTVRRWLPGDPPPSPLGRIQLHDEASRSHAYPRKRVHEINRVSVRHRMDAPNVDQFYTSGCVGFAGANFLNCGMAVRSRRHFTRYEASRYHARYLDNNDGLHNYSESTKRDPFDWVYPPTDEGSSALGLMKFWKEVGVIGEYRWCFTFDQFLAALQRQPVLVGTNWYEGMMTPDSEGNVQVRGDSVGGHEYLATAILWETKRISFENSWGEGWGRRGRFYINFYDFADLLADGGDAVAPVVL
jgi:hypothetical protein